MSTGEYSCPLVETLCAHQSAPGMTLRALESRQPYVTMSSRAVHVDEPDTSYG